MTLKNFFEIYQNGASISISVHQEPYLDESHKYFKTYFEEVDIDEILDSNVFKRIADKKVDHFNIIGGGIYPVELCVYLESEGR